MMYVKTKVHFNGWKNELKHLQNLQKACMKSKTALKLFSFLDLFMLLKDKLPSVMFAMVLKSDLMLLLGWSVLFVGVHRPTKTLH